MFTLIRLNSNNYVARALTTKRFYAAQSQLQDVSEEYTDKPEYPEILDPSREARLKREKQSWHNKIKALETVEEKLIKINMPRYYGFLTINWNPNDNPYNSLPIVQHYTRTIFDDYNQLPNVVKKNEIAEAHIHSLVKHVSNNIKESVEYSQEFFRYEHGTNDDLTPQLRDKLLGQAIVENINRTLINSLSADVAHLKEVEVDINPRHEAFWAVGGVDPPKNVVKSKKGHEWQKDTADAPVDRLIQYKGEPYLTLRHKNPLPPIKSVEECTSLNLAKNIPVVKYDPRSFGFAKGYCHGTNIPGHWPGSLNGFGLISFQPRDHLLIRDPKYGADDFEQALHVQAIQSSFAWLLAQANYNGFNTYNDLTYPMSTQTVITNGKHWSFYHYQLNTTLIHSDHVYKNPKVNMCWGSKTKNLFEDIDSTGKCVGFNEEVVKQLVKLYINAPVEMQCNIQPYLSSETPRAADISDDDRREFVEKIFKHMVANRPRHLAIPEIYLWERIYKIDNKTRPLEARRRFFEVGINPWKRTLDQHDLEYIPRAVRPGGPKSKPKFKKTYYPK